MLVLRLLRVLWCYVLCCWMVPGCLVTDASVWVAGFACSYGLLDCVYLPIMWVAFVKLVDWSLICGLLLGVGLWSSYSML